MSQDVQVNTLPPIEVPVPPATLHRDAATDSTHRPLAYRRPQPGPSQLAKRELAFTPGRAVFLASFPQHLDTAMLLQRFALDADVVPVCDINQGNAGKFGSLPIYWPEHSQTAADTLDRVRAALAEKPAFIVAGPVPALAKYPADILGDLRTLIADGAVFVHLNSDEDTQALLGADASASTDGKESGDAEGRTAPLASNAKRILTLKNGADVRRGYLDGNSANEADFDRSLREFARTLAALSGSYRQRIRRFSSLTSIVRLDCQPDERLLLELSVFRRSDCARVAFSTMPADVSVSLSLDGFPDDAYYAVAELVGPDGRLHDWATLTFETALPHQTTVTLDSSTAAPGDLLRVTLQGDRPVQVACRWTDGHGRVLLDGPLGDAGLDAGQLAVPRHSLSVLNHAEFTLTYADHTSRIVRHEVLLPANANVQDFGFRFFVWNICDRFSQRDQHYFDALKHTVLADGICNCADSREAALQAARSGMTTIPYSAWFHKIGLDDCLFNEEWLEKTRQRVLTAARNHRDFGAAGYTLGDECYIDAFTKGGRFSGSEPVWVLFREFLGTLYGGSLAALNEQWETHFATWQDVHVASDSALLPSLDNPSAWTDYRMFVAATFARTFRELRALIRTVDPDAKVGWDGCEQYSSYDGIDWWEFTRDMDINVVYAGSTLGCSAGYSNRTFNSQAVKSFNPRPALSGAFLNDINPECGPEYSPWLLLLHGYNSMWWWHASYPQPEYGALNWDLNATPVMRGLADTMREIRSGIGALLAGATKVTSPIAIHYSANNYHASTVESGVGNHFNNLGIAKAEFWMADRITGRTIAADAELMDMFGGVTPSGHCAPAFKNFLLLFKDLGYQPLTLSRQQIELGSLQDDGFKVLVLPFAVSLSDAEAAHITRFVEAGGLVIADYQCGLRDLHGKRRAAGALDPVFGISHRQPAALRQPAQVDVEYSFSRGGRWDTTFRDDIEIVGTGCVLKAFDDGTPMPNDGTAVYGCHADGAPAFIVNHHGKGAALFLNFDLYAYAQLRQRGGQADTIETFRYLLWTLAGMRCDLVPRDRTGAPVGAVESVTHTDGDIRYLGLLPDFAVNDPRPTECFVDFPADRVVYDVRRQQLLGCGRQYFTLQPGKPMLLASLPAEIRGLKLATDTVRVPNAAPGQPPEVHLQVSTRTPDSVTLTVRVEFLSPAGTLIDPYTRILQVRDGAGTMVWSPALNDPQGEWEIRVTDVISGLTASAAIDITHL